MSTIERPEQHERDLAADPIADPGLPEHTWRPTDVDRKAEKRAERQVAGLFGLATLLVVGFVVSYFVFDVGDDWDLFAGLGASNLFLGLTLGGALLCIGIGIIQWARKLMGDHEIHEMRHPAASSAEDRQGTLDALAAGTEESGITRRPLIRNSLLGALGITALAPLVMLRDLGPTPKQVASTPGAAEKGLGLEHTVWKKDMRVVRDVVGTPIRASELQVGDLVNAEPEALFPTEENGLPEIDGHEALVIKSKAAVIVVRMEPDDMSEETANWSVDGIVAYSKICTHVGCPISLYERTTHHVLCPCHQSTFDLADKAKVVFGPAGRPLPQLPLAVNEDGELVAQSDFPEVVGPSFWERDTK